MKIMVTGALGNVGTYVIEELLRMGEKVIAADVNVKQLEIKYTDKTCNRYFDFTDHNCYEEVLKDVDRVFLMRPPHLGKAEDLKPFIDKLKQKDIQMVTFLSLMGIEKNPIPPHYKIEKYIEEAELPYAHIRPGFFMQNLSGIHATEIKENNTIFIPAGNSKVSFIDAADIGLAAATLLRNPKQYKQSSYTITGKEALDYSQIAQILSNVTGRRITYSKPSFLKYRNHYIRNRQLDKKYVHVTMMLYLMTRMGTTQSVTQDFEMLTGKEPCSFETFAVKNIDAFI